MTKSRRLWKSIIEEFTQSGLTGSEFCRVRGISLSSFYKYKKIFLAASNGQSLVALPVVSKIANEKNQANPVQLKDQVELIELSKQIQKDSLDQPTLRISAPSGLMLEIFL